MKETTELAIAVAKTINSAKQALGDKQITFADLQYIIDDVPEWQRAIKDLHVTKEVRGANNVQLDAVRTAMINELSEFSIEEAFDIGTLALGVLSGLRFISRITYKSVLEEVSGTASAPVKKG